jgi:lipoprotein NlpI
MLANAAAAPDLESIDKGVAAIYALIAIVVLWLLLAGLLLVGAGKGDLPAWAAATAFLAHLLWGAAAFAAVFLLSEGYSAPHWPVLFLALPPPLFASYALWAHFPRLHARLPPKATSAAVLGTILAMSVALLGYTAERQRERTVQSARNASAAQAEYVREQAEQRQQNLARFQSLSAESPLSAWAPFIGKGNELEKQAAERARALSHRQDDAEAMLRSGDSFPLFHIGELDLHATPALCSATRDFLLNNARANHPASPDTRYVVVADRFDAWLPAMRWLIGQRCDLASAVAAMEQAVLAYQPEPERDKFLAALGRLDPEWRMCHGDANATRDQQIAGCAAAIALSPTGSENNAVALFYRGDAHLANGATEPAIRDYSEAIRIKPDFAEALNNRGNAYDDAGDRERAIKDYDDAIRIRPDFARAFSNRGNSYDEMGEHSRAIQDYDQAIRLDPQYRNAFKNRGRARYFQGDFAAAAEDFSHALSLKRADAYVVLWLHLARGRAGATSPDDLHRDAGSLDRAVWPWPVVAVYLGEQDGTTVLHAATEPDHACDAAFYLGARASLIGDATAGRDMLQQALDRCQANSIEYFAAKFALERDRR